MSKIWNAWSQEDLQFLAINHAKMKNQDIADYLHRPLAGVKYQIRHLKLSKKHVQTACNAKTQLCESCQKACGGCSWSDGTFTPVPGWEAVKSTIYADGHFITKCPEYAEDPPRVEDVSASDSPKKVTIFAGSPCETTCRNEKRNQCLQNNGRCAKWDKWFAESGIWQRTIEPLREGN